MRELSIRRAAKRLPTPVKSRPKSESGKLNETSYSEARCARCIIRARCIVKSIFRQRRKSIRARSSLRTRLSIRELGIFQKVSFQFGDRSKSRSRSSNAARAGFSFSRFLSSTINKRHDSPRFLSLSPSSFSLLISLISFDIDKSELINWDNKW